MKRFLSFTLLIVILVTSILSPVQAKTVSQPTTQELESVIIAVRSKIEIDDEKFSEFSWDYSAPTYYSDASWYLSWNSPDYNNRINITCDQNGNIINYNKNEYTPERKLYLAEKDPSEYLPIVENFISKIAPFTNGKILLTGTYLPSSLSYPRFSYTFTRYENGIIVPDNTVTIVFDYQANDIRSFNCAWEHNANFDLASESEIISIEKAKQIIGTTQNMNLSYRLKTEYDENSGKATSRKAYLVYTPALSYISVDAVTGEIYTQRDTWTVKTQNSANGSAGGIFGTLTEDKAESESSSDLRYELNEKELEQLEVLKNLISKEDAINTVINNEFLYIDKNATAIDARLSRMSSPILYSDAAQSEQQYCWNISFSQPYQGEKVSYYFDNYMTAKVDAQNGKLISFYANVPNYYYYTENNLEIPAFTVSKEQAQTIAESFLSSVDKDKFENTVFSNNYDSTPINYIEKTTGIDGEVEVSSIYRLANFNYVRQNEGVLFTYNSLGTCVDLVTGKITNYSYNWYDDVEFESTKDIISKEDAFDMLYQQSNGFGLNYEINSNYTYNQFLANENDKYVDYSSLYSSSIYTRKVYSLYNAGTTIIRASDGERINYSGEIFTPESNKYIYDDIENHWAKDIILKFSYTGIGFDGESFKPDEKINASDFVRFLGMCGIYSDKTFQDSEFVTRTDAVKYILDHYGYKKIAALEDVFITDFTDNFSLKKQDVGYIAIAKGFGLIEGDDSSFRPYEFLTRAECMTLCYNIINSSISQS